ncbi:MAG: hypothetical protein LBE80_03200, partial [Deltaproteobacteria bacterium]|nr:hypothetical protein [Deltaproteobacteria bacterium]
NKNKKSCLFYLLKAAFTKRSQPSKRPIIKSNPHAKALQSRPSPKQTPSEPQPDPNRSPSGSGRGQGPKLSANVPPQLSPRP